MRARPFLSAGESPRPFSEVVSERNAGDTDSRRRELVLDEIQRLEGEASIAIDPAEAKRLQCEAEHLRCLLAEQPRRSR